MDLLTAPPTLMSPPQYTSMPSSTGVGLSVIWRQRDSGAGGGEVRTLGARKERAMVRGVNGVRSARFLECELGLGKRVLRRSLV